MILVGNQRGGSANLAGHLMSAENEHVRLHELRGFVSETLAGALNESYAISRGTRCKQHLFSLSLNPPADADVSAEEFEAAIGRVEKKLGLRDQPRAIVFHEKKGMDGKLRRHCHAVWSRIDADEMKAVQLSHSKRKLMAVSRDLFIHHDWDLPRGLIKPSERNPLNFTHEQWQQAKRIGKDPRAIKQAFQDAWALSDSKSAFTHALAERGYHIAKGDRRGFVAVDAVSDEVFAIPKWVGIKTKAVRERLGDEEKLPSITETRANIADQMLPLIQEFAKEVRSEAHQQKTEYQRSSRDLTERQRREHQNMAQKLEIRRQREEQERSSRYRSGLKGLWDRLRGEHKRITQRNQSESAAAASRDRIERNTQTTRQLKQRRSLRTEAKEKREQTAVQSREIKVDIRRFDEMKAGPLDKPRENERETYKERRKRTPRRSRTRGHNGPDRGL